MVTKQTFLAAALYARVSSDQQAEAGTVQSQVAALREQAARDGQTLAEAYCFIDEGYSGATLLRPALERLRDAAAAGAIDRLYVHSPDRLARKYAYQVLLLEELARCGVEVVFLNQGAAQTPEQDLLLQVQGMMAEYERAKILERSRRGKRHRAAQGCVNVLGGAPYGYRYVTKSEGGGQARYEVIETEAAVVRQVFEWMGRDRLPITQISRKLHEQAIPTRTGKTWWDRSTVWAMLHNPAYQGTAAFGKTRQVARRQGPLRPLKGKSPCPRRGASASAETAPAQWTLIPVPAIVEPELFATVQGQLEENRRRAREGGRGARYLLQGLLVCKRCGYAYYGKRLSPAARKGHPREYVYYRCIGSDAFRFGGQRLCQNKQLRSDLVERAVWADICDLLEHPERIEEEYRRRLSGSNQHGAGEQREALMQKLKRGIARLVDAYAEGLLEAGEFEPRLRQMRQRLAGLEEAAKAERSQQAAWEEMHRVLGRLQEFGAQIQQRLGEMAWGQKREIIRALVQQVEVDQDGIRIIYRGIPRPFELGPTRGSMQHCSGRDAALMRRGLTRRANSHQKPTASRKNPSPWISRYGPNPLGPWGPLGPFSRRFSWRTATNKKKTG